MSKNIYDMLNEVEVDLKEYDKENFTDIEKRNIKNRFKESNRQRASKLKKGIVAASIAILLIGASTTNLGEHVYAYANNIAYNISSFLGIEKDLDPYKTVLNKSITKNGLTVQLNEVIFDTDQLVVSYTATNNEKVENGDILLFSDVYINGRKVRGGAGGGSKAIDDYTVESVMSYDIIGYSAEKLKGDLDIKLVFSDAEVNGKNKRGTWKFRFKTNGDELFLDTQEIPLQSSYTLENGQKVILEKYTSNNLGQKIYFSKSPKGTEYNMMLKGHDDLGNEINFYVSRADGGSGMFILGTINGNLEENAKTLTLTPYAVKYPEKSGRMSSDFKKVGEEFIIELSE